VVAELIVGLIAAYVVAGLIFGCAFVLVGVDKLDPAARKAPIGFRLLILPGSIAFWPLLASRWFRGVTHPPVERTAHRVAATPRGGAQ